MNNIEIKIGDVWRRKFDKDLYIMILDIDGNYIKYCRTNSDCSLKTEYWSLINISMIKMYDYYGRWKVYTYIGDDNKVHTNQDISIDEIISVGDWVVLKEYEYVIYKVDKIENEEYWHRNKPLYDLNNKSESLITEGFSSLSEIRLARPIEIDLLFSFRPELKDELINEPIIDSSFIVEKFNTIGKRHLEL